MINKPTCFKNPEKPSYIDLILTNCRRWMVKMVTIVMKTTFRKIESKVIKYRDYNFFLQWYFLLLESLQNIVSQNLKSNCDNHYNDFAISCKNVLDKIAPWKKKYIKGNHSLFMNKTLSKAIMVRTKLRNTFFKYRSEENKKSYNMQRNYYVSLLQKSKRDYYNNLNEKNICDNSKFCKSVKPLVSNKCVSNEKITLVDGVEIIKTDQANAKVLNNFFSNIMKHLEIPQFSQIDPISHDMKDPVIKYRNHPSIIAIEETCTYSKFSFLLKKLIF